MVKGLKLSGDRERVERRRSAVFFENRRQDRKEGKVTTSILTTWIGVLN
jgi:hypothetical protein